jgi:hypothetical protein
VLELLGPGKLFRLSPIAGIESLLKAQLRELDGHQ